MVSTALSKPIAVQPTELSTGKIEYTIPKIVLPPREKPVEAIQPTQHWAVKTNLLQLGVGIANVGVELPIARQLSVDIPFTYSPYTVANSWKMRTLSFQPELRWWLHDQMNGHFVGLHTHVAYYNIASDDEDRYQDKDGKTPLWGGGLSYGYALTLKGRWGMEFTLGLGYAHLNYDIFYNVNNGEKYATETKDYWGLTRAGITLIYKFNK